MTKNDRRKLHQAVNDLTYGQVGDIVKNKFPKISAKNVNLLAKKIVAAAHASISPKK